MDIKRNREAKVDLGNQEFIFYDFSKSLLLKSDEENMKRRVESSGIVDLTEKMFSGEKINFTEGRSVRHVLLRSKNVLKGITAGTEKMNEAEQLVCNELKKMKEFTDRVARGVEVGLEGGPFDTIVNIGIGGSSLGSQVVCDAMKRYTRTGMNIFFVSNIDPAEMHSVMSNVNVGKTLFIVVSKTFTTQETMANASLAIRIASSRLNKSPEDVSDVHFVAVTSDVEKAKKFGIKRTFAMWDFVGGRYSLWSAVGLCISLYVGFDHFLEILTGASICDENYRANPTESPEFMHALVELYYGEIGYGSKCILPYDFYMRNFHLHIQQLEMESNGKRATIDGKTRNQTGMIVWGGVGTNSQHSFFQLLHQGSHKILCEFLLPINPIERLCKEDRKNHTILVANCLAQSEALMTGRPSDDANNDFPGGTPSITIMYSRLTPRVLGALIAHYEHKVFIQGSYWGVNSFDQFGVKLGKEIANGITTVLETGDVKTCNYGESTRNAVQRVINNTDK